MAVCAALTRADLARVVDARRTLRLHVCSALGSTSAGATLGFGGGAAFCGIKPTTARTGQPREEGRDQYAGGGGVTRTASTVVSGAAPRCSAGGAPRVGGATRLGVWTRPPALYCPWTEPGVEHRCVWRTQVRRTFGTPLMVRAEEALLASHARHLGVGGVQRGGGGGGGGGGGDGGDGDGGLGGGGRRGLLRLLLRVLSRGAPAVRCRICGVRRCIEREHRGGRRGLVFSELLSLHRPFARCLSAGHSRRQLGLLCIPYEHMHRS